MGDDLAARAKPTVPRWQSPAFIVSALAVVAVIVVAMLWTDGSDSEPEPSGDWSRTITAADVSGEWPFTVDSGVIECAWLGGPDFEIVTFEAGGVAYGLNGVAHDQGYPHADPIWKPLVVDGQEMTPARVSIGEVAELARSLC